MIEITAEIRALIDKAAAGAELAGDEYIDPADGLIHCKKCKSQCQREAEEQRKAKGRRGTAATFFGPGDNM